MQRLWRRSGSQPAFTRNTAEPVYTTGAAHNPEVAGSNPAPATGKGPGNGAFPLIDTLSGDRALARNSRYKRVWTLTASRGLVI